MNGLDFGSEGVIRLTVFLSLFVTFAILERIRPKRRSALDWRLRWLNNLSLSFLNAIVLKIFIPFSGTAFAALSQENNWSPVNLSSLPLPVAILCFIIVFDMTIYFQHRLFHRFNFLWTLHRVHHTDIDYDLTTGNRFHPLSIIISMLIKLALVLTLGAPVLAILLAEILLNATSMFNHSNLNLPRGLERRLRYLVVTPDMHRIHHSVSEFEHSRNFGFNFSFWDRLFGTYLESASEPQETMKIGIKGFGKESSVRLDKLILQPTIPEHPEK